MPLSSGEADGPALPGFRPAATPAASRAATSAPAPAPAITRRALLRAGLSAAGLVIAAPLAGCQRPSTIPVKQVTLNNDREDLSDAVLSKKQIRVGMEAAYAPYNWQVSQASDYTIPIDNVKGAYADGYDVQVAKIVCAAIGKDVQPVAVKMTFSGLIDSLNNGQIDLIIAGMTATPERKQSVDFSKSYFTQRFGLFVKQGSPYASATKLSDFKGASVLGQKDTELDTIIDEIPGVNHVSPVDSVPNVFSRLLQGTVDAVTYNVENEAGYMKQNPGIVPIKFADGQGFKTTLEVNVGMRKGSKKLLKIVNKAVEGISEDERTKIWNACLERQPA